MALFSNALDHRRPIKISVTAHAWAMTIVIMMMVEAGFHIVDRQGPFESYGAQAVTVAAQRVASKFTAAPTTQAADGAGRANGVAGAGAIDQMVHEARPGVTLGAATGPASFGNPFVENLHGVFIPHPFAGYVGVQSAYEFHKDYFGYRNDEDTYFGRYDPATRPEVLITWSGNSEAVGLTHATTVPEFLERILNTRDPNHIYKTINLATNGYALNDEIAVYVAFAYDLKPEFSITHSGITDVAYGGALPGGFKQLGLIYTFDAYYRWVNLIYGVKLVENLNPTARMLNPDHMADLIPGILKSYRRFDDIVTGNGGELIHGLPPNNPSVGGPYWSDVWLPQKLRELHDAMSPGSFIDFTKIKDRIVFHDSIHTETESAKLYAGIYADEILRRMKTRKLASARLGAGRPVAGQ